MLVKPINEALSPGDIIGVAFGLLRNNIGFTVKVLLVPTIINTLGSAALQWAVTKPMGLTQSIAGMGTIFLIGFAGVITGIIAKWILTLRQMALMRMAGGFSTDWQEAYKTVSARKWHVVALWFLTGVVSISVFVIWLLQFYMVATRIRNSLEAAPAIIFGVVAMVMVLSIVIFGAYMSLCLLACDTLSFRDTINRTASIIAENFWRCLGFSAAFVVCIMVLSYPLTLPIALLGVWDSYRLGVHGDVPIQTVIVGHVWESFINLLISPLFSFAFAAFYVDLLNRKEGLDLERRLIALSPTSEDKLGYGTERS